MADVTNDRPPPIPKSVWSQLGPVEVRVVKRMAKVNPDVEAADHGSYDPAKRIIRIRATLEPWTQWQTLLHEWGHCIVFDAGLHNLLTEDQIETLVEVYATAMVARMRHEQPPLDRSEMTT